MPKSRKKKVKHQDFAKVKLKVGKKLPRAANETNASFQSRSIQIKDQFRGTGGAGNDAQPSTKRKLAIGDLLSHCQHYNTNIKYDALVGLRELLVREPQVINTHMSLILERSAELLLDKDSVVRLAVQRLFKIVLPGISPNRIAPFFPVLSAHLCCAMSHIHEDIQADSLNVLDLLLDNYPELVITNSSQILPNFLEQISRLSGGSSKKEKEERTLVINPGGKLGSNKWRVNVLDRLKKLLQAMVAYKTKQAKSTDTEGQHCKILWRSGLGHQPMVQVSETGRMSGFSLRGQRATKTDKAGAFGDKQSFQSFMKTLVPLLLESWVEVGPGQLSNQHTGGTPLSSDALMTLSNVLHVLMLLFQYADSCLDNDEKLGTKWLKDQYQKDFVRYFMLHFPYDMHEAPQKKSAKSAKTDTPAVSVQSLNLTVCHLMTYLMDQSELSVHYEAWFETIADYLTETLRECKQSTEQLKICLAVVQKVLQLSPHEAIQDSLLDAAYYVYRGKHPLSADVRILLQFFMDNFLSNKTATTKSDVFSKWIETLPSLLQQVANQNEMTLTLVLKVMKAAAVQRNDDFLSKLEESLPQLMDDEFVASIGTKHKRQLVELLYNIPRWRPSNLAVISKLLLSNTLPVDVQIYMLETLGQKILRTKEVDVVDPADYLSFLFTVAFGQTKEDITKTNAIVNSPSGSNGVHFMIIMTEQMQQVFKQQHHRIKCILDQLHLLASDVTNQEISELWCEFLCNILNTHQTLCFTSVTSILETTSLISKSTNVSQPVLIELCHLVMDAMATSDLDPEASLSINQEALRNEVNRCSKQCLMDIPDMWVMLLKLIKEKISIGINWEGLLSILGRCCGPSTQWPYQACTAIGIIDVLDILETKDPAVEFNAHYGALRYATKPFSRHDQPPASVPMITSP